MLPKAPFLFPISNEYCPNTELDMILGLEMIFLPVNGELQLLKGQSERILLRAKSMIDTLYLFKVYRVICEV
jgi:hypothetical protein